MKLAPLFNVRLFEYCDCGHTVYWLVHTYKMDDHFALSLGNRISIN